ncbi:MAG: SUMF1/EgtB/PvdO family nonheme iron enzyme [Bacteroidia bacterium]
MESNKPIEDKDLDKLLKDLLMQENSGMDENAAKFVFSQEYDVKIDAKKEKQLLTKLKGSSGGYWNYWILVGIALVIAVSGFIYFKINQSSKTADGKAESRIKNETKEETVPPHALQTNSLSTDDTISINKVNTAIESAENAQNIATGDNSEKTTQASSTLPEQDKTHKTHYPVSKEKQKSYDIEKNKMIERLVNIDKGMYSSIEEGKISYRGEEVILDPFVLRNQTITNLEYKIFLSDLLQNGKTEDYEKAMVKSEVWNNYAHPTLAAMYFSNDRYNNFPVVNIGTDGALLFCKWLEAEVNKYFQQHKSKSKINIRLPFDSEWIFATKRGYVHFPDCEGYNTVYDKTEGIVDAHYLKWTAQIKKRDKKSPNELDAPFGTNRYGMTEKQVLQLFEQSENATSKLVSDSVYPFKIDVYNKVAHVSEIIYTQGTTSTTVIGSCWKSKKEYMQMLGEFNKASASPYVGFRIVVLNGNKASYKAPFW